MNWFSHLSETQLALFSGGDLTGLERASAELHMMSCARCRARREQYQQASQALLAGTSDLPPGLDWESLSAEMSANIHLGLTAGELVRRDRTPGGRHRLFKTKAESAWRWQTAAVCASLSVVFLSSWWMQRNELRNEPAPIRAVLELPAGAQVKTVDFDGGERTRQLDGETGQVTITQVYAD